MPFRRTSRYLHPVNTIKHVVDLQNTVGAGLRMVSNLVTVADNPDTSTAATECAVGSYVRSIYLNITAVTATNAVGTINNAYMYVIYNPNGQISTPDLPELNQVGTSNQRKQVFHQEMAMMSDENDSIPVTLFKGVIRIPKKAQRNGLNDFIQIAYGAPVGGPSLDVCIQCIYKEIR